MNPPRKKYCIHATPTIDFVLAPDCMTLFCIWTIFAFKTVVGAQTTKTNENV